MLTTYWEIVDMEVGISAKVWYIKVVRIDGHFCWVILYVFDVKIDTIY